MRESNLCKVFVGNVPHYDCDQADFSACFENMEGYVKAEIIYKPYTRITRGFGFVLFNSPENALKLRHSDSILFNGRQLRFTEYNFNETRVESASTTTVNSVSQVTHTDSCNKHYILVKNLPRDVDRDYLLEVFTKISAIGRCFIGTNPESGKSKGYGVVEILDENAYNILLEEREIITNDGIVLDLGKWKLTKEQRVKHDSYEQSKRQKITHHDLRRAFLAGKNSAIRNISKHAY